MPGNWFVCPLRPWRHPRKDCQTLLHLGCPSGAWFRNTFPNRLSFKIPIKQQRNTTYPHPPFPFMTIFATFMSTLIVWGPAFSTRDNPFAPRVMHVLQAQVLDIGCPNTPLRGEPVIVIITFKMETLAENAHQVSLYSSPFSYRHLIALHLYMSGCVVFSSTPGQALNLSVLGKSLVYFDFRFPSW